MNTGNNNKDYNEELEQCIIGALIIDASRIKEVLALIDQNSFFDPTNNLIFSKMIALSKKELPIDPILLNNELFKTDKNHDFSRIYVYANNTQSIKNLMYYVKELSELNKSNNNKGA